MSDDLKTIGRNWLIQLKDIASEGGSVGELSLSEEETLKISRQLKSLVDSVSYFDTEMTAALTVTAVNLAYYFYDGSGGAAFLKYLLNDYDSEREIIGRKIESLLSDVGIITDVRWGPYRYIGLIIRQAIITKKFMPSFKFYLKRLDNIIGFEKFGQMSLGTYLQAVEYIEKKQHFQGGIFREILQKEEGFHLLRSVGALLDQVRSGETTFEELKESPGFRTGFWNDLNDILTEPGVFIPRKRYRLPVFVYNSEHHRVGIAFDEAGASERLYRIEIEDNIKLVESSFFPFTNVEQLKESYTIQTADLEPINLQAWCPISDSETIYQALFRADDGKLVSSLNNPKTRLTPGEYFLITSDLIDEETRSILHLDDFEELDIDSDQWYYVWPLNIDFGTSLQELGACSKEDRYLGLQWENPTFLPGTDRSIAVFSGGCPRCKISGWERLKNRYCFVQDIQGERNVINEEHFIYEGHDVYYSSKYPTGKLVRLRLEIRGFSRLNLNSEELQFLLLPPGFRFRWSYELLGKNDTPKVFLTSTVDLKIRWDNEHLLHDREGERIYEFNPGTEFIYGKSLEFPGLTFCPRFSLAQAYPITPPSPSTRQILWSSSLEKSFSFDIRGHYDSILELGIDDGNNVFPVWKNTEEKKRHTRIRSYPLKDGIPGWRSLVAGRFVIKYENTWKDADCVYLSEEGIIDSLINADETFLSYIDEKTIYHDALEVIKESGPKFKLNQDMELPESLKTFFCFIEAGVALFDYQELIDLDDEKYQNIPCRSCLEWYAALLSKEQDQYTLFRKRSVSQNVLPILRWQKKIDEIIYEFDNLYDLNHFLSEIEKSLDYPFGPPTNQIASLGQIQELILAIYHYRQKSKQGYKDAYQITQKIMIKSTLKPVLTLAKIILNLSLVNLWRSPKKIKAANNEDPWDSLALATNLFLSWFKQGPLKPVKENRALFNNFLYLLNILDENLFHDLIYDVLNGRWRTIQKIISEENIAMYLVYKNDEFQEKTHFKKEELRKKLLRIQNEGKIPYNLDLGKLGEFI